MLFTSKIERCEENIEQAGTAQASIATAVFGTLTNRGAMQVIA